MALWHQSLSWRGAGDQGEPELPLPGSCLRGRHKISQQIMKLSLIAEENDGWGEMRCVGESPLQGASTGHEKHLFGGAPPVNGCSVFPRSWHSLGMKDGQWLERS